MVLPQTTATLKYRPDIDGLRAIAILLVLVFHFDLVPAINAGFVGVDIFFVISGYLITNILREHLEHDKLSIRDFYVARIRRLAPALTVVLVLVLLIGLLTLFPSDLVELCKQLLASQFYLANVYFWKSINYFGINNGGAFFLHMWSLAVEEQFYLVFPLCLLLIHKFARAHVVTFLSIALLAAFALNVGFVNAKPDATFYLLPTRGWELLAGSLTAYLAAHRKPSNAVAQMCGTAGALLVAYSVIGFARGIAFPGYYAVLPVLGAACMIYAGTSAPSILSKGLSNPVLVYVGRISYPLYLVHWPIFVFANFLCADATSLPARLSMLGMSVLLASLIFHGIEQPVRNRRIFKSNKHLVISYVVACTLTVVAAFVIYRGQGLPQRFPAEAIRLASFAQDKTEPLSECQFSGKPFSATADFCQIGSSGVAPTWIVYGDSHAWAAHGAFNEWLSAKGESGLFVYLHACIPVVGVHMLKDKGVCHAFNNTVSTFVLKQPSIQNALIVSTWRQAVESALTSSNDIAFTKDQSVALFKQKLGSTLKAYSDAGKRVYVWEPVPGSIGNAPSSLARAALRPEVAQIEHTKASYLQEYDFFFSTLEDNKRYVWLRFSPGDVLCQSGMCAATIGGDPVYFDNGHVTKSSAKFWVAMMLEAERRRENPELQ